MNNNKQQPATLRTLLKQFKENLPQSLLLAGEEIAYEDLTTLFSDEYECIRNAVPKRQREFASGRKLSKFLLHQMGHASSSISMDEYGCPQWPPGIVGSITHTDDYCLVVLGKKSIVSSVGIDMEKVNSVEPGLWSLLFTDKEVARLNVEQDDTIRNHLPTIFFTAKEAFYKHSYPLDRQWRDFKDVNVIFDDQSNKVSFFSLDGTVVPKVNGFSSIVSGHVVSIVWSWTMTSCG